MKGLRTLKYFQIFKIKIKYQKPIAVDVLIKAYPIAPHSFRSNLARRYFWNKITKATCPVSCFNFLWLLLELYLQGTACRPYWDRDRRDSLRLYSSVYYAQILEDQALLSQVLSSGILGEIFTKINEENKSVNHSAFSWGLVVDYYTDEWLFLLLGAHHHKQ